ncbi:hypothetical protein QWZ08_19540 [Ferruginibacter paludis]|uniref:hypothetical protein n=1 Tax=Ferruginibacter paludis TaxID=1310417 RepID=UPI0025B3DCE1|nr:hypothetical protein [Ferruginibacter paludis]MDN3657855.1 hypothetical protein [Ferruginibacter paludis]
MEFPMKMYGMNAYEYALSFLLKVSSWFCLLIGIIGFIFRHALYGSPLTAGLVTIALTGCAVLLGLTGAGVRQNKAVKDSAYFCLLLTSILLLYSGIHFWKLFPVVAGVLLLLQLGLLSIYYYKSLQQRFKPRFFSLRQFETMIMIADTMIDADAEQAVDPVEAAITVDHMFNKISAPAPIKEIKLVMFLVEWILPLLVARPLPFSNLGTNERRSLVEKIIGAKDIFRNVAKVLKLFSCVGYYGNPKGMAQVGYIPFDERPSSQGKSQTPSFYPDPFSPGGALYGKV